MISAKDVLDQVMAARMTCESMAIHLRGLEGSIRAAMQTERKPVGPVAAPDGGDLPVDCTCPANLREVSSIPGEPGKTKCKKCGKEYSS